MATHRTLPLTLDSTPARWAESCRAPLWVSVCLAALSRADAQGRSDWEAGELAGLFMVRRDVVARAITQAVHAGWLDPSSTSCCLVLADA
jgi:hypothetical protein